MRLLHDINSSAQQPDLTMMARLAIWLTSSQSCAGCRHNEQTPGGWSSGNSKTLGNMQGQAAHLTTSSILDSNIKVCSMPAHLPDCALLNSRIVTICPWAGCDRDWDEPSLLILLLGQQSR